MRGSDNPVDFAIFSPDGKRITTKHDNDSLTYLWDSETGALIAKLDGNNSLAFSDDGSQLATVSESVVKIWDSKTGGAISSFPGQYYPSYYGVSFSHDGRRIISISEYKAQINDVRSGTVIATFDSRSHSMGSAVFSRDDFQVWTTSDDGTLTKWSRPTCDAAIGAARAAVPREPTHDEKATYFLNVRSSDVLNRIYNDVRPYIGWIFPIAVEACR
jgi:WD40 repeat protein